MPAPTAASGDAIQAAINVAVAQSRRLVSSWLPPPTPEEIALQKTDEQLAKEDAELFAPMPPRLGLGAPIPKDFLESSNPKARRQAVSANEALKRKIMGREKTSSFQEASKPRPQTASVSDTDDEEGGRSSLGKPKRLKMTANKTKEDASDSSKKGGDEGVEKMVKAASPSSVEETASPKGPTRFGAYLDVHKAEKAKKKKKKKRLATN